jgi:hypothetical protein
MDPYVERDALWPDIHLSLIVCISRQLQPILRPRFVALIQHREYFLEGEGRIQRVSAQEKSTSRDPRRPADIALPDTPLVVELWREEIRESVLQIIEPGAGNRIVTSIEVLGPANKTPGTGREVYLQKQKELWRARTNLVEIDLLRAGLPTVRASAESLNRLGKHHYLVAVSRSRPTRCELYGCTLRDRLPKVGIPLTGDDADVVLELQKAFEACWETGPYPELLRYDGPPPGELDENDAAWCRSVLREAGFGGSDRGA